jgi:hypothetical protein
VLLRISCMGELASSRAVPKISGKSVRKKDIRGAGMLSVGANTMPTFLTVILLRLAFSTISIKKDERCRSSSKLACGNLCTSTLNVCIFLWRSSMSVYS